MRVQLKPGTVIHSKCVLVLDILRNTKFILCIFLSTTYILLIYLQFICPFYLNLPYKPLLEHSINKNIILKCIFINYLDRSFPTFFFLRTPSDSKFQPLLCCKPLMKSKGVFFSSHQLTFRQNYKFRQYNFFANPFDLVAREPPIGKLWPR